MDENKFDIIVYGGGIAGLSLAQRLVNANYRVLILDHRKARGKNKICSGIITKRSYKLLSELYDINDLCKYCVIDTLKSFKLKAWTTADIDGVKLRVVNRHRFDIFLTNQYKDTRGKLIDNCGKVTFDFENNLVIVDGHKYKYDILVGADGVNSPLRYAATGHYQDKYISMQAICAPAIPEAIYEFEIDFNGYYWYIATQKRTYIGAGEIGHDHGIVMHYNRVLKRHNLKIVESPQTAYRPTGNDIELVAKEYSNVFFVGDAAGLISPLTGEGIYYALVSSKMLADSIINRKSYEKCMKKTINDINNALTYKTRMHNYIYRTLCILIMSLNLRFSKKMKRKLIKKLNLD